MSSIRTSQYRCPKCGGEVEMNFFDLYSCRECGESWRGVELRSIGSIDDMSRVLRK